MQLWVWFQPEFAVSEIWLLRLTGIQLHIEHVDYYYIHVNKVTENCLYSLRLVAFRSQLLFHFVSVFTVAPHIDCKKHFK